MWGSFWALALGIVVLFALGPREVPQGSDAYDVVQGTLDVGGVRALNYLRYAPKEGSGEGGVILAHGLLRDSASMAGWAEAWARAGLTVVSVDLIRLGTPEAMADENGADLLKLGRHLGWESVVYAGFSSGGLSSLMAASGDPSTVGVLLFDTAEIDGAAWGAAYARSVPILHHSSPPHLCNGDGAGALALADVPHVQSIELPSASHCWFEMPYSQVCSLACGEGEIELLESTQGQLVTTTTDALQSWLGRHPKASDADVPPTLPSSSVSPE